jgi:hypothetical protein
VALHSKEAGNPLPAHQVNSNNKATAHLLLNSTNNGAHLKVPHQASSSNSNHTAVPNTNNNNSANNNNGVPLNKVSPPNLPLATTQAKQHKAMPRAMPKPYAPQ